MAESLKDLKADLLRDEEVRRAYEDMAPEFEIARAIIKARAQAGLTQAQLAERMETSQSYVARIESGRTLPNMKTLMRVAKATGTRPRFEFETA